MGKAERCFLGHDLGRPLFVLSTLDSVDDAVHDGTEWYRIHTALPPAAFAIGGTFGLRQAGVDYGHLLRRRASAMQEEADYGLSVTVLSIGAAFAYDSDRLRCDR